MSFHMMLWCDYGSDWAKMLEIPLVWNCKILIVSLGKGEIWDNLWGRKSLSPKCGQFVKTGFYSRSPMMMPIVGID